MLSDLDRLIALEDIQSLQMRFCRALDGQQWAKAASMMTPNARTLFCDESGSGMTSWGQPTVLEGPDALIDFTSRIFCHGKIIHTPAMPEIRFLTADRAMGEWRMSAYSDLGLGIGIGFDETTEDYVRIDSRWFIDRITVRIQAML